MRVCRLAWLLVATLSRVTPQPPPGLRPTVEVGPGGPLTADTGEDPARPHDLLAGLATELHGALAGQPDPTGETAPVTGASPGSIALRRLPRGSWPSR